MTGRVVFGHRPAQRSDVVIGVVATLFLHAALIGAIIAGTLMGKAKIEKEIEPKMMRFEDVDLLALGEKKPPNQLPRIPNPEPKTKPPDEINLKQPKEPVVDLKKKKEEDVKEDEKARKKRMLDALSALNNPNRPTNDDLPAGSTNGVVGGDISDAALANLMGTYAAKLIAELSRYWELPSTVTPDEAKRLAGQVTVYVRLSESGNIVSYDFRKHSSNPQFDASIERVLKRFEVSVGGRKLPLPTDEHVRQAVIRQGLNLKSWEYTGR